jgi:hypothetical protein
VVQDRGQKRDEEMEIIDRCKRGRDGKQAETRKSRLLGQGGGVV